MVVRVSTMYASAAASSSLAMLPSQPSLPEVEVPLEEDEEWQQQRDHTESDRPYAVMPISPLTPSFQRGSPMARSSSQRRISLELGLSNGASAPQPSPRGARTPAASSTQALEEYRFPTASTPVRQGPTRRHSSRGPAGSTSHPNSLASQRDYFGSDMSSSDSLVHRVPFPSSNTSLSNCNSHLESPSAKRIARHVSLSGAAGASVESINLVPASPKNAGPIPIPPRPAYRHLRYSSDLHLGRNHLMAASRSDVSIDDKSRSRLDSEVGSLYTNTLGSFTNEDGSSASGLRFPRDAPPASKHKLVVVEEGKANVTYQMGNCIGRGQFGSVYRALNLNTGQMVAVKRIKLEGLAEDEVTQLMGEVDLLKSLTHPSVVKYEGLVRGPDVVSIILEYVENGSLSHTLKAFGNFPEKLVASYVVKILEGLNYLHEMKVVHCDLKAANILTTKNGNVKLSDFGVSLNLKAVENIKNDAIGTPNWMAPEVIELKGASTAADIWSLGCTIIELLTGKPPYGDMLAMSALWRIVEDDCPPFPDKISDSLRDFLTLCFNKDPALRPRAETLFEHEWLRKTWNGHKELRPQDSVPFLRRISADARKVDAKSLHSVIKSRNEQRSMGIAEDKMERSSSPPPSLSLRPHMISMRASSAPDAWSHQTPLIEESVLTSEQGSPLTPSVMPLASSPPAMSLVDLAMRRGSDVASANASFDILRSPSSLVADKQRNGSGRVTSPEPSYLDLNAPENFCLDEQTGRSHAFVKITFSKAVSCKICRDAVKKHAVLCEECGLICHAGCAKRAISPCNLRAQLLLFGGQGGGARGSMDLIRGISPAPSQGARPTSPGLSSGQETPPMSPRLFKFPFTRAKRDSTTVAPTIARVPLPHVTPSTPSTAPIPTIPTTPATPLTPLAIEAVTPSGQNRRRRISLMPYIGRRRSPSPAPIAAVPMSRSLSSSRSIHADSRRDDSLGYGSSISSNSSSGPGGLSMSKTISSSSGPHVPESRKHHPHHSIAVAAASTPHLHVMDKEAERKAKRRQSASAQRALSHHDYAFPSLHTAKLGVSTDPAGQTDGLVHASGPPNVTAKRSRRMSTKQDCTII